MDYQFSTLNVNAQNSHSLPSVSVNTQHRGEGQISQPLPSITRVRSEVPRPFQQPSYISGFDFEVQIPPSPLVPGIQYANSTGQSGDYASTATDVHPKVFRGVPNFSFDNPCFFGTRLSGGLDGESAVRFLQGLAFYLGADFADILSELLYFSIVNGTGPSLDRTLRLFLFQSGRLISFSIGDFFIALNLHFPCANFRQFMSLFADNARQLITVKNVTTPLFRQAIYGDPTSAERFKSLCFDYSSECSNLTDEQILFIQKLPRSGTDALKQALDTLCQHLTLEINAKRQKTFSFHVSGP